jgi:hypothetical protein
MTNRNRGIGHHAMTVVVVLVPQARPLPTPPVIQAPPAQLWAPPLTPGLTPGPRSPAAKCYTSTDICALAQPDRVGEACTCDTAGRQLRGRALIPPSHDSSGRQLRPD